MTYLLRTSIILSAFIVLILPTLVFGQEGDRSFVPLTSLPGLDKVEDANNLADFFNQLFRIAIGVAATLAVFQIMHAGVKFMTNKGSISENEEARQLLQGAVFGLILVLSPVIVFGIINPKILELDFDVSQLKNNFTGVAPGSTTTGTSTTSGPTNYTRGAFLTFMGFPTEEEANQAKENCRVPEEHQDVIAGYQKEGPTLRCPPGVQTCESSQMNHVIKCEANSKNFIFYAQQDNIFQNIPDSGYQPAPGENAKIVEFRNGCINIDRGHLKDDLDFLTTSCGDHEEAIRTETGTTKRIICKQKEFRCQSN